MEEIQRTVLYGRRQGSDRRAERPDQQCANTIPGMFIALLYGITHLPLTKVRNNADLPINQIEGFLDLKNVIRTVEQNIMGHVSMDLKGDEVVEKSHQKSTLVSSITR